MDETRQSNAASPNVRRNLKHIAMTMLADVLFSATDSNEFEVQINHALDEIASEWTIKISDEFTMNGENIAEDIIAAMVKEKMRSIIARWRLRGFTGF